MNRLSFHFRSFATALLFVVSGGLMNSVAAEKVTFEEHVLPIFRNNCLKCHNPDKTSGDLDLSTFGNAIKGGGSGPGVNSGDPDGSKLYKVITHAEEPIMPPKSPKMADKELDVIKRWIEGGLLESSGSKALASKKPKTDLSVGVVSVGKPDGPPPMPEDLLLEPVLRTERTTALTAVAGSPWAPLIALGVPKQILLFNSDTLELAGVLPFPEGHPNDLKFSRNGKLLLAGGGHAAKSGMVVVWNVKTGERVLTVGDEFDAVLAADISSDQEWIALGGPPRLIKIFSTKTGEVEHQIKKHTDWVTAIEFSPDGKLLATGDRAGGLIVWEADTGQELTTLKGHRGAITSISWRDDSQLLLSSSEDGSIKLWKPRDGDPARNLPGHGNGTLWARYTHDGRIASCGRDGQFAVWDTGGNRKTSIRSTNDIPVRIAFSHDGNRVFGVDWLGNVGVWSAVDGKEIGIISANPQTLAQRSDLASRELAKLELTAADKVKAIANAETDLAQLESQKTDARKLELAREKIKSLKAESAQLTAQIDRTRMQLSELKAATFNVTVYKAKDELAEQQKNLEKQQATAKDSEESVLKTQKDIVAATKAVSTQKEIVEGLQNVLRSDIQFAEQDRSEAVYAIRVVARAESSLKRKEGHGGAEAAEAKAKLAEAQADLAARKKAMEKQFAEAENTRKELEAAAKLLGKKDQHVRDLAQRLRQEQTDILTAIQESKRLAVEIEVSKKKIESLTAEYRKLKLPAKAEQRQAKI